MSGFSAASQVEIEDTPTGYTALLLATDMHGLYRQEIGCD